MPTERFLDVWTAVAAQTAAADPLLARTWTLDALRKACAGRRWGFLRRDLRLRTTASRSLTVTATQGSATVTGSFLAADAGRQLQAGGRGQPYQILQVASDLLSATLHQAWQAASGATAVQILDAFLVMPEDFDGCRTLRNLTVQRFIPWWLDVEQLDAWDPNRLHTDTNARAIFGRGVRTITPGVSRVVYEWWPYITAHGEYDFSYYARPDLADEDPLPGVWQGRGYLLRQGALVEAAGYPGTPERRNPYFNLGLRDRLDRDWQLGQQELSVRDDDVLPGEQVLAVDWRGIDALVPRTDRALRSSDASADELF